MKQPFVGAALRNSRKTHCKYGHPLSGDNLIVHQAQHGIRACRTCQRNRENERRAALKASLARTRPELPPPAVQPVHPHALTGAELAEERAAFMARWDQKFNEALARAKATEERMDLRPNWKRGNKRQRRKAA